MFRPAGMLGTVRNGSPRRIFLVSPASCAGERARLLIRKEADFPLARRLREPGGAELGEVFSFLSGLYFRGKLAYARAFDRPPAGVPGALVITPTRGMVPPRARVTAADLREFAAVSIDAREPRYRDPLAKGAAGLASLLGPGDEAVLLGSIATGKYVDVLGAALGARLLFPADFAGRGDMSRGGLLLRSAREGRELAYVPAASGARHGRRPPKLPPRPRAPAAPGPA